MGHGPAPQRPVDGLKEGEVYNDYRIAKDAFRDVSVHAMGLFAKLQEDGVQGAKDAWTEAGGTVYDL